MKHFVVYNAAGEILRAGVCTDDVLEFQAAGPSEFVVEAQADVEADAVDPATGQVIAGGRPPPPVDMDYRKARADVYPSVREQMDMLWHAMDGFHMPRVEPFYSRLKAVKDAYPKDNSVAPGSVIIYPAE
jgi:hypothetical protein